MAFGAGRWWMCWVWLAPVGGSNEGCGIRASWDCGACVIEAWQGGRRVTLQETAFPVQDTLKSLISLAFGIS